MNNNSKLNFFRFVITNSGFVMVKFLVLRHTGFSYMPYNSVKRDLN